VAIVHDYLTQRGGAERVVLTLAEGFPGARIYTSVYEPEGTYDEFRSLEITTSPLNHLGPIRRDPRRGILLLAPAFARLSVPGDALIVSSSAWAHGVHAQAPVIVYCHSPARWMHQPERYAAGAAGGSRNLGFAARALSATAGIPLRRWDQRSMHRADRVVVNSTAIARRVAEVYGIDAEVLPPAPALIAGGIEQPIEGVDAGFWLTVARLLPYKNVTSVLEVAAERSHEQFVIVGDGPLRDTILASAPPNVMLLTESTDAELRWLYRSATGLLAPAHEDFGLTPLEAASFATPTIALRALGHLDTIVEGVTGVFFDDLETSSISQALDEALQTSFDPDDLVAQADRFGSERFIARMREIVNEATSDARG
jgi:glycosyltransferase involved in cell wall biosynthesis